MPSVKDAFFLSAILFGLAGCQASTPVVDPTAAIPEICCGGQSSTPNTQDQAVPGLLSAQLGRRPQGPEITHTFVIKNPGQQSVTFTAPPQVNYPCCMTAEVTPPEIPPGGQAQVSVTYKTRLRPGPFDLFVRLFPSSSNVVDQLHLSGQVEKSFVVQPKRLDFTSQRVQSFTVSGDQLDQSFRISEVKSNSPHISVVQAAESETEKRYTVTWDGEPVKEKVPVVYVITDSEAFGWAPVLIKGVGVSESASHPPEEEKP